MKHWIAALSLLTLNTFAMADELNLGISNTSVDGKYEMFFGNTFSTQFLGFHGEADDVERADMNNPATYKTETDNIDTDMMAVGIFANGRQNNIRTHLGGKAFYLQTDIKSEMHGLALGGSIDAYVHPSVFFTVSGLYSPNILTGGDFDNYLELDAKINFQIIRNAGIFAGYKVMQAEFPYPESFRKDDSDHRSFFEGLYVGFRFTI
jgi:hypothetical protein